MADDTTRRDRCGCPEGAMHHHIEQCHRGERAALISEGWRPPETAAKSAGRPQPTPSGEVEALTTAHCSTCGHQVRHHEPYPYLDGVVCKTKRKGGWCDCPLNRYEALLTSDWLAAYVQAAREES